MKLPNFYGVIVIVIAFTLATFLMAHAAYRGKFFAGPFLLVPFFIFVLFWIWELQKRLETLREELKRLKEKLGVRDSKELYTIAYDLHYSEKDYQQALEAYQRVIEQFPDSAEAGYADTQIQNIERMTECEMTAGRARPQARNNSETHSA